MLQTISLANRCFIASLFHIILYILTDLLYRSIVAAIKNQNHSQTTAPQLMPDYFCIKKKNCFHVKKKLITTYCYPRNDL